jgi:Amt family ammonium transporter
MPGFSSNEVTQSLSFQRLQRKSKMKRWFAIALVGALWGLGALGLHAWAAAEQVDPKQPATVGPKAPEGKQQPPAPKKEEPKADDAPDNKSLQKMLDTVWTLVAAFLVFWMNAGFGCVEAGFCRAKNAVNILGKNFVVFGLSSIAFWFLGYAFMFGVMGEGDPGKYIGMSGFMVNGSEADVGTVPRFAHFFFQLVFAGTAATIVSGCVAERIHYGAYMIFAFLLVAISYPITGHWIWGGGWLSTLSTPFQDFAGSTVVHSVGGWAGLVGIILLGPRIGKYDAEGKVTPIPGHNMGLVFLGGMILWLGWFGFNPGSTLAANPTAISHIVVTTNLACAAGLIAATATAWIALGSPDFSMTVNGALAGLVAITAPCAYVSASSAIVIGLIAGVLVVYAVLFFDKMKLDDPVGALSVHLVNGIWGTLSVGLFAKKDVFEGAGGADGLLFGGGASLLISQVIGVIAVGVFTVGFSFVAWLLVKAVMGLRVELDVEVAGLDKTEMGMEAYPNYQMLS